MAISPALRVHRGDIVRVDFDPVAGREQAGIRPALVVSPEVINRGDVIVVAAITGQKTNTIYPWEAIIEAGDGGLKVRSKVMFRHLRGISTARITGSYGSLAPQTLQHLEAALQIAVGLERV